MNEYKVRIVVHGSKTMLKRVVERLYINARAGRTKAGVTVKRYKAGDIVKVKGSVYEVPISFHRLCSPKLGLKRDIRIALRAQGGIAQNDAAPWLAKDPSIRKLREL